MTTSPQQLDLTFTAPIEKDGAFAMRVLKALEARGVFVRKPMAPGLDRCIRVSVGPAPELDVFAEEFPRALADAAQA